MKNNILLLSVCSFLMLAWASCTDSVDYTPAEYIKSDCSKMSFTTDDEYYEFAPSSNSRKVTLTVTREKTDDDVVVPLVVNRNDDNVFSIPETISFSKGQSSVDFDVNFPEVVIGQIYKFEIALPSEFVDPYSTSVLSTCGYSVQCIQWDLYGTGNFNSSMFRSSWEQAIYKASHAELYKLPSLYAEGADILVDVEGSKAQVSEQLAFVDSTYGNVYVSGSGEFVDKTLKLKLEFYCSAGSFGEKDEVYTLQ